jgi:hypothetical protein
MLLVLNLLCAKASELRVLVHLSPLTVLEPSKLRRCITAASEQTEHAQRTKALLDVTLSDVTLDVTLDVAYDITLVTLYVRLVSPRQPHLPACPCGAK